MFKCLFVSDQYGRHAHTDMVKTFKIVFSEKDWLMSLKLDIQQPVLKYYQLYSHDVPRLTFDLFTNGQLWFLIHL